MNEQEHFREPNGNNNAAYSANLDDKTMHELYLWLVTSFMSPKFANQSIGHSRMLFEQEPALLCVHTIGSIRVTDLKIVGHSITY